MRKLSFSLLMVLLMFITVFAQENRKHKQHRHLKYAEMKNPVPMTAQSIAEGGKHYGKHCTACHGEGGKGGTGANLAAPALIHGNSDGEIFHAITDGIPGTAMRGFGKELSKEARWHLVNYIRSFKK